MSTEQTDTAYLTSRQTRDRYGNVSLMWLHRRLNDDSGFPRPVYMGRRRFWRASDLIALERAQAAKPSKAQDAAVSA